MKSLSWTVEIRARVNARLQAFFAEKRRIVSRLAPPSCELIDEIADLTLRGGKRLRPITLFVGFRSASPEGDPEDTLEASIALELLQTYLLIHDDWMDQDERRRNGPTIHAKLEKIRGNKHLGGCLSVVAGDLACGYAWEAINQAPFRQERKREALQEFATMHQDIVLGQHLDLISHQEIERMYDLKSGSYTVRGPLKLGAILGDATREQLEILNDLSRPIGIAFQLRDDLLSAFGKGEKLGKPVGNDLRAGKHTLLVSEAMKLMSAGQKRAFERVLGNKEATDDDVAQALGLLVDCGAKQTIEQRIGALSQEARQRISESPLSPQGVALLLQLIDLMLARDY
ncbi:MAG: polyprenyl synthetase family protein [Deltaproteobacteria bacterium]|nr:polyprenyl synthetase family protein [Deltaproteobacteria bacterium]